MTQAKKQPLKRDNIFEATVSICRYSCRIDLEHSATPGSQTTNERNGLHLIAMVG